MEITTTPRVRLNRIPAEIVAIIAQFVGRIKLRNGVWMTQIPRTDPRRETVIRYTEMKRIFAGPYSPPHSQNTISVVEDKDTGFRFRIHSTFLPEEHIIIEIYEKYKFKDWLSIPNIYRDVEISINNCPKKRFLIKCDGSVITLDRPEYM